MAKTQKFLWHDLAIILLIILAVASNVYWMISVRDINDRLDIHTKALLQLTE